MKLNKGISLFLSIRTSPKKKSLSNYLCVIAAKFYDLLDLSIVLFATVALRFMIITALGWELVLDIETSKALCTSSSFFSFWLSLHSSLLFSPFWSFLILKRKPNLKKLDMFLA